jgi:transcriptional regulator GlxA family with amidase domain
LAEATVRLARCMLETALSDTEPHQQSIAHDYLLDRMVLFIKDNHAYADLDAHTIAAAHNISARQLFKIWAPAPLSLNETIIAVRLDAARRMLERNPGMTIGAVSSRNGFVNPSHFSRRFRQAYGLSPRDVRGSQTAGTEHGPSTS